VDLKTVTARSRSGLNQRLGLSRNKVAVPEGVAGTPPFWSIWLSVVCYHDNNLKVLLGVYYVSHLSAVT